MRHVAGGPAARRREEEQPRGGYWDRPVRVLPVRRVGHPRGAGRKVFGNLLSSPCLSL